MNDEWRVGIGQYVPNKNAGVICTNHSGGVYEVPRLQLQHGTTHDPDDTRRVEDDHCDDNIGFRWTKGRHEQDCQDEAGEHHETVNQSTDDGIKQPVVAGKQPKKHSKDRGVEGTLTPNAERDAGAIENPREQVAPQLIGTKRMSQTWTKKCAVRVDISWAVPGKHRSSQSRENDDKDNDNADYKEPVPQHPPKFRKSPDPD